MRLPTGTVTFLFTDIEGSTRHWENHPEAMSQALARHDLLLNQTIPQSGGVVFKTIGDAFCCVFSSAADALSAALAAQHALLEEAWPESTALRVRIALHTGAVESRGSDYFGPPLNRIARLLSTAHGGQVVLSAATQELVRDNLPQGAELFSLGEHRLKDLGQPETIYQLIHPSLPRHFEPLRSLDNPALQHNLPQQVTSFVGREKELGDLRSLLQKTRLLTLIGSGGSGKTRLALQVAAELLDGSGDGAWLVELAALSDPALVPQAIGSVFGITEEPSQPLIQSVIESLKNKHLLLILDNCEHLLDACASIADMLLRHCPRVLVLATSREALGIAGETTYRVPSLTLPDPRQPQTPESLAHYEAGRLFIERAAQVQTNFAVTRQNAPAIAAICHRLDGIPLAIELAAARVRSLAVEEVNQRLDQRFRLLTGGSRTALPRQQTLRSLIDWSYDLLDPSEQTLLVRLSVFAGGWTLAAAEQVCTDEAIGDWESIIYAVNVIADDEVLDLLTSLVDKSLVVAEQRDGQTRYRLLETVRQYARDRQAEWDAKAPGVRWHLPNAPRFAHLCYFVKLAEEAETGMTGADQQHWLETLDREHDNLRAALETSRLETAPPYLGLRLAGAIWRYWYARGYASEGRRWLTALLGSERTPAPEVRAKALNGIGNLSFSQGDYAAARPYLEESLALRRQLGDQRGTATALGNLGNVAYSQGDFAAARALFEESLALRRQLGDQWGISAALSNLGMVTLDQGDYAAAQVLFEESLTLQRERGDRWSTATTLGNLGLVAVWQGDDERARTLQEESLAIRRELGDRYGTALALGNLGNLAIYRQEFAAAHALLDESLTLRRELEDRAGIALTLRHQAALAREQGAGQRARPLLRESLALTRDLGDHLGSLETLEELALVLAAAGHTEDAVQLWGALTRFREEQGSPLPPNDRARQVAGIAAARQALPAAVFESAWQEGAGWSWEHALAVSETSL